MLCALFVFYFNYYVGVLRTICFLLSLIRWCCTHYLFSTLTIMLVCCTLSVFYFYYCIGMLRTIWFLLSLTFTFVCCALFVFYFYYYVGVLRAICFLLWLLCWCFAHYFFSTFTLTLVFCALFVFLLSLLRWCFAHYLFSTFFNYYVGVLHTICFLL